jgi:hypothetical protein
MKTTSSVAFALLLALLVASEAQAVDEGQTQPKLSSAGLIGANTATDLIPITNGAGNVKGIACRSTSATVLSTLQILIYVDGGAASTLSISTFYPFMLDNNLSYHTNFIPMNVRFDTSIRVVIQRSSTSAQIACGASWGLD